ncbi:hypothetical protein TRSC58_00130 [Trypanosoma rangeli SC58]|uniref:Pentacotripeptide-repeat region of PRORP domain-containing protein n=1 Tax=Trypanosoma rangeli SC58 TaxID=429131 RepID=A0A061J9L4_TRYRA|nr:hypothetical protein TRSC58_06464 [Trypanosoma rangeli SC58]ESL12108.1 hypothetical protein TRSC58_00130 [Trypanosoma rangeli SC58]
MHPRISGLGVFPRYGGGWMHQFGHVYALQQELLNPQSNNWFRAVELWHTARHEGIALNSSHYTNILRQCVQSTAWEAALKVLRQMQREGVRPDVDGVGCVLAACADAKRNQEVEEVFNEFSGKMALDSVCYLALIKAKMADGKWKEAIAIGKRQEADGVHFLPHTYTNLLEAANEADDGEFALECVRRMRGEQWGLSERGLVAFRTLCVRRSWRDEFNRLVGSSDAGDSHFRLPGSSS